MWRVVIKAQTRGLSFGKHQAQIQIETDHPEVPRRSVPVTLDLAAPVAVIPSQFFFGEVEAAPPSRHKVLLRFSPDVAPARAEDIVLSHDVGGQLSLTCVQTSSMYWELVATLTLPGGGAAAQGRVSQGTVVVSFAHQELPMLRVPVYARVR